MEEIKIGNQIWMTKNLDTPAFRNGDLIPEAKTGKEWEKASKESKPCWCHYDYESANGKKYGKLYNWYAVNDTRGLAPEGWHVPSDKEWETLVEFLGKKKNAGKLLKATDGWSDNKYSLNETGFNGLPGGYFQNGEYHPLAFMNLGNMGIWWSATKKDETNAWSRAMFAQSTRVERENYPKGDCYSIRCVKS